MKYALNLRKLIIVWIAAYNYIIEKRFSSTIEKKILTRKDKAIFKNVGPLLIIILIPSNFTVYKYQGALLEIINLNNAHVEDKNNLPKYSEWSSNCLAKHKNIIS